MTPFWDYYLSAVSFLFGACVGSFLNVCIHRIPRGESIVAPRSRCPHCGAPIAWYDNIPLLSFLLLRARCRRCRGAISPRYFLVELLVSILFLAVWGVYGASPLTPVHWLVVSGLVLATFVDIEHLIIPDRVSLGGIAAGLALSPLVPALHGAATPLAGLTSAAIGAASGAGLLYGVSVLGKLIFRKDAMGLGDVKLLGAIGAFLGWRAVLFTVVVSSFAGAVAGLYFIVTRRKEWQSRIPYGPYLALAAAVWILGGCNWWAMYLQWLLRAPPM